MKLGFVFQKDSHLKAVQATALRLSYQYQNAEIQFYALDSDIEIQINQTDATNISTSELPLIQDCDYLICCLGGYLLNKVITQFAKSNTKVIALFPGIVSHYQLDAFISRFNADQVWLNCQADYDLYVKLCQVFGVKNNGILYGIAWFFDKTACTHNYQKSNPSTIFFEQTQIISNPAMAQTIEQKLIKFIQDQPNKLFIYKMRENIHSDYLVRMRQNIAQFNNVKMLSHLLDDDICQADTYLTVSSSAVIEGILLHKQCYLLDGSILTPDAQEVFGKSGLFLNKLDDTVKSQWISQRVHMPTNQVTLSGITKQVQSRFDKRNVSKITLWLGLLMYYYPKLWNVIVSRSKLKAIQKALEYISL